MKISGIMGEYQKIFISIFCFIAGWWIFFRLFSPSEVWTMLLIPLLLFAAYGIQPVEWVESDSKKIFDFTLHEERRVYQQYRIFRIIPISPVRIMQVEKSYCKGLPAKDVAEGIKTIWDMLPIASAALPFGGYLSRKGKHSTK